MKGISITEALVSLAIISLAVVSLSTLISNYLLIMNSLKYRFLALNLAQEGLELAFALRNKQIEKGSSPWSGISLAGKYCLSFNKLNKEIVVQPSNQPCRVFSNYSRLVIYNDFENSANSDLSGAYAIKVVSEVYWGKEKVKIDSIITKWHPIQE